MAQSQQFLGEIMGVDATGQPVAIVAAQGGSLSQVKGTKTSIVFPSAALGAGALVASSPIDVTGFTEMLAFIDVTAVSGTVPTLDVKFQTQDALSGKWFDVASASFAQKTGVASEMKLVTAGLGTTLRAVYTIAGTTPNFTFSVGATFK